MTRRDGRFSLSGSVLRGATILALASFAISCEGKIVDPDLTASIVALDIAPTVAPADGATQLRVTASVAPDVAPAERSVSLATTLGSFGSQVTASADADGDRNAVALLTAPSAAGTAIVTAKLGGTLLRREVTFERALAESIEIGSSSPSVASGFAESVTISVTLRRGVGKPTAGDSVSLATSAGILSRPTRSNNDGVITATFTPGEIAAGVVTVRVTAIGSGGKGLTDSVVVRVLPKS